MKASKTTVNLALAELAPTGKISYACRATFFVLALYITTNAWAQTSAGLGGPHRLPRIPSDASSPKPVATAPATAHYQFLTITTPESAYAVADGINNAGLVTGYYADTNLNYHGFVWFKGAFQTVDYPGATNTLLFAVNNRGVAIGYYGDGATNHTVTYSVPNATWTALPDIPGFSMNEGYGINDSGAAVGNAFEGSTAVAWMWDPETSAYSYLAVPGAAQYSTAPNGLNNRGQVAGWWVDGSGAYHGFVKDGLAYTIVDVPGATDTYPDGINNRGIIEGQWLNSAFTAQGFLETIGGFSATVDYPGPAQTAIAGINDRGDLAGGYWQDASGPIMAFIAVLQ